MLYIFLGDDGAGAKQEVKRRSSGEVLFFGEGGGLFSEVSTHLSTSGLFSETLTLVLDQPTESDEGKQLLEVYGKQFSKSGHTIFILERALDAKAKKLFSKDAQFEVFDTPKQAETPRPNVFAFTDLVLRGDKKNTWLGYQKLLRAGISAEEIHGALSWAVRSALLAGKTKNATEAGLKPFVYTKSKRVVEKFGAEHFENLSRSLVSVYHRARMGDGELSVNLEKLLLEKI